MRVATSFCMSLAEMLDDCYQCAMTSRRRADFTWGNGATAADCQGQCGKARSSLPEEKVLERLL